MSAAKNTLTVEQQAQLIAETQQQIASKQLAMMGQAQSILAQRASDLQKRVPAFAKTAAAELKGRIAHYQSIAQALADARRSAAQMPQASADNFILHGRVFDSKGKPVAEATVSVSDAKGEVNARIPAVQTDANGFYTITLRAAEYPDLVAAKPQMFVSVTNAKNQELAKPTQTVSMQPGTVAVLPIVAKGRVSS